MDTWTKALLGLVIDEAMGAQELARLLRDDVPLLERQRGLLKALRRLGRAGALLDTLLSVGKDND